MPWLLYPQYPVKSRLGGPHSQSGCSRELKNSQPPSEIKP